ARAAGLSVGGPPGPTVMVRNGSADPGTPGGERLSIDVAVPSSSVAQTMPRSVADAPTSARGAAGACTVKTTRPDARQPESVMTPNGVVSTTARGAPATLLKSLSSTRPSPA